MKTFKNRKYNFLPDWQHTRSILMGMLMPIGLLVVKPANAQNSLPGFTNYSMPNPAPSPPGNPFNPIMSGSPATNTPACAEWTRNAGPDESIVLTGSNLSRYTAADEGKDTRFTVYGFNGTTADASIQRIDSDKAIITVPKNLPAWSMYLIWPGNDVGYGAPIAVNKTDAWWVGPDKTARGTTASVYGRNLAQNNGTSTSNIYIKPASGAGQWATVTSVNPYKVDFTVPSSLAAGDYEVWVHNGHGGQYGWSGPLTLTVSPDFTWTGTQLNVKNYGAKGDGSTDDTQAINNAVKAAGSGATVYLPAGTYMVSGNISLKSNIIFKGDGASLSTIKCATNFSGSAWGLLYIQFFTNVEVKDMGFDGNNNFRGNYPRPIFVRADDNIRLTNLKFSFPGYDPIDVHLSKYIFITNCEIIGKTTFLGNGSQLFIDKCQFKLTNDTELAMHSWGGIGVSLTNNTSQDYNNSNPNDGAGWGQGRFFVGNGAWGSLRSAYIAQNTTIDLAPRAPLVDQNTGEQFMWEGMRSDWTGTVSSSNGVTTNLNGLAALANPTYVRYAVIIKGKGLGQSRRILSYNGSSVTLESPWNLQPDNTSQISIGTYVDRTVLYKNTIDGKQASVSSAQNASAGIEPYGGVFNFIADNNTIQEVRYGLANWATEHSGRVDPNYFSFYSNNKLINCRWGVNNALRMTDAVGTGLLGAIYRNNTITSAMQSGLLNSVGSSGSVGSAGLPICNSFVFEYNTITGVKNGFSTGGDSGLDGFPLTGNEMANQLFYKNNISGSGGYGIKITPRVTMRENNFSGFSPTYNGSILMLESPNRVIEMNGQAGAGLAKNWLTLWNAGVNSMAWTATSSASWLTLSASSGAILDQKGSTTFELDANPDVLPTGTYKATVTLTAGDQTRTHTIVFKVVNSSSKTPPGVNLTSPAISSVFLAPANITLTANASDADGSISKVEFYAGSTKLGEDTSSPYSFVWTNATAGTYDLTAKAIDNSGLITTSAKVTVPINSSPVSSCPGTGSINWYYWLNVAVVGPSTVPVDQPASGSVNLTTFSSPINKADRFGSRTRGYVCPPADGEYIFYIAGDDQAELYLSTNDNPAIKQKIAYADYLCNGQYDKFPSQISAPVQLKAGQRYYIEALHADGSSGDYIMVGWKLPNGVLQRPINGAHLVPFEGESGAPMPQAPPIVNITSPSANATYNGPATITIAANASDPDGSIAKVEFFNGSTKLGEATSSPYSFAWTNVGGGSYTLSAKATDNGGLTTTSGGVNITVNTATGGAPTVSITSPSANAVYNGPATVTIAANASDPGGSVTKVEFFNGSTKVGEDVTSPYSFDWTNVTGGSYTLSAKATDNSGLTTMSATVNIIVNGAGAPTASSCSGTGSINWSYWGGRQPWDDISSIPVNTTPTGTRILTTFSSPANLADGYGSRARGYICPPADGAYVFYIAGDDQAELYLSTNEDPANKRKIASADYTCNGLYDKLPSQISASIQLKAGQRYYIEALQSESAGGDYMMVGWKLPNGTLQRPITGANLIPYETQSLRVAADEAFHDSVSGGLNAYPNPFHTKTTLEFTLPENTDVTIQVFDMQGNLASTIPTGAVEAGKKYQYEFDGSHYASGIYLCKLIVGQKVLTRKLILVK